MASLNESCPSASLQPSQERWDWPGMGLAQDSVRQWYPWDRFPVLACSDQTMIILTILAR